MTICLYICMCVHIQSAGFYTVFIFINSTFHPLVITLPFGGVGNSGFGSYHGKFGFDAFSHKKACYVTTNITEPLLQYVTMCCTLLCMICGY